MRRRWRKWCLMMKGGVIGEWFWGIMREGEIIRNILCMIIGVMFILEIKYH